MVADEGEGDNADGLEDTVVDQQAAFELASQVGRLERSLGDDRDDYNHHGDQG